MKNLKFIPFLMVIFLLATSCSKEKKIEKNLYKKEGKWNITTFTYSEFENNVLVDKETYGNVGSFVFNKNKTGIMTTNFDGDVYSEAFTWTNSENEITIISGNDAIIFKIISESKKSMELEFTDSYSYDGVSYKDVTTLKLDKE
jgi:hypothetical protein